MKRKYQISLLGLSIMMLAFSSCKDEDRVTHMFDQSPTERLENAREQWYTELQSAEYGWKLVYFPLLLDDESSSRRNQFTYLFRFLDDRHVTMEASTHGSARDTSEYDIALGSTLKLRFITYNFIHELSNASNSGSFGTGGRSATGDFEFYFYGKDGDDLLMHTNRKNKEVRFERATAEDWGEREPLRDELLADLGTSVDVSMRLYEGTTVVIDSLASIDLEGKEFRLFEPGDNAGDEPRQTALKAVGYGVRGILVMPAIEVGEQSFYFFRWDREARKFVSEGEDARLELTVGNE